MNQTRSEPSEPQPIGREDTASDLRSWARGALATEAAVELLIGACHGRLVEMALAAVGFDATQIATGTGGLSAGRSCSAPHYMIWPGCWQDSTLAAWPWFSGHSAMPQVAGDRSMTGSSTIKITRAVFGRAPNESQPLMSTANSEANMYVRATHAGLDALGLTGPSGNQGRDRSSELILLRTTRTSRMFRDAHGSNGSIVAGGMTNRCLLAGSAQGLWAVARRGGCSRTHPVLCSRHVAWPGSMQSAVDLDRCGQVTLGPRPIRSTATPRSDKAH
jgi:hypothetical protein